MKNNLETLHQFDWYKKAFNFTQEVLKHDTSGHDIYHAQRCVTNAIDIMNSLDCECNETVIILSALVHDTIDEKIHANVPTAKYKLLTMLMSLIEEGLTEDEVYEILFIVDNMSFRKNLRSDNINFQVVQDADLLESVGAIGVVRTAMYTGSIGSGDLKSTIDYYYDRLSKVIDRFNIDESKELYSKRFELTKSFFIELEKEVRR